MNARNIKPHQSYLNHDGRLGEHPVLTGAQILAVVCQWCGGGENVDLEEYAPIRLVTHPFHPLNRAVDQNRD